MKNHFNIPVFIPHLGCPNGCVFCNQHSITGKLKNVTPQEVCETISEHLKFRGEREAELAFFGGSFTGIDIQMQKNYLEAAKPFLESGELCGIRVSTRPDYISDDILELLCMYGVTTVELGAQSMCDDVLKASKRGHTGEQTEIAANKIKQKGMKLGLQMMVGLPGDTSEKSLHTANEFVRLGADMVRIYPTVVLYDTELYNMYKSGSYTPLTVEEAVRWSARALDVFEGAGVKVLRIGLQETDTLCGSVAAGAYHPAIGEMVYSERMRALIDKYILEKHPEEVVLSAEKRLFSHIAGYGRSNIEYIKNAYKIPVKLKEEEKGFYINGEKIF